MKNEALQELIQRWRKLEARERKALTLAAGFILASLLYGFLWLPMQHSIERLSKELPQAKNRLVLMQVQAAQVRRLRSNSTTSLSSDSLLSTVEQAAVTRGLRQSLTNMEPDSNDGVRLSFDAASFNAILSLLSDLQTQYGLRIETATVQAQNNAPGIVNARFLIRGAGQ